MRRRWAASQCSSRAASLHRTPTRTLSAASPGEPTGRMRSSRIDRHCRPCRSSGESELGPGTARYMDTDHRSYIVKRNEPITEEAPNTSTDRSTRHSPGRTLRGYRYFRACPRQASLGRFQVKRLTCNVLTGGPFRVFRGLDSLSTPLRPGSH